MSSGLQTCTRAGSSHARPLLLLTSLLLAVLAPSTTGQPQGGEPYYELRCLCLKTNTGIHPSHVAAVTVNPPGPHCPSLEVIATLKDGRKLCLDPEAALTKKLIQRLARKTQSQ